MLKSASQKTCSRSGISSEYSCLPNVYDGFEKKRDWFRKNLRYLLRMVCTCLISWFDKTYQVLSLEYGME